MNKQRFTLRLASLAISSLIGVAAVPSAHAVHGGIFELDANALDQSAATDDWQSFHVNPPTAHTTRTTGIVADTSPAVFRQGSKDIDDISAWRYDLGSAPPKDDMLHAYAAAYNADAPTIPIPGANQGDLVVYFGADRAAFNGTASLGFWFFKNPVVRDDATKRFINPVTGQPATHANGDTLVAFEYTNGGAITTVKVFVWQNGALVDKGSIGTAATTTPGVYCNTASAGIPADSICGATNPGAIPLPWNGTVSAGQFFEGGINLSQVIGGDACFASFMATSRTSSTATASIKNFILHSFPVCSVDVTKTCSNPVLNASNNTIQYTVTGQVLNDGGGVLQNISLTDNPPLDSGTLGFFTCDANGQPTSTPASPSSLAAGAAICYSAKITSASNGPSDTITVSASTGSGSVTDSATATCPQLQVNTGINVTKVCDLDIVQQNNQLVLKVNFAGSVCNTSDVALSNVKVCETHGVSIPAGQTPCTVTPRKEFSIGTMAAGACVNYQDFATAANPASYFPANADVGSLTQPDINPVLFKDQVGAVGTPPAIFNQPNVSALPAEATCGLCPTVPE